MLGKRYRHCTSLWRYGIAMSLVLWAQISVAASQLDIQELIDAGRAQEAYALAQQMSIANSGLPQFDFLYGLAAVEAGHPDDAVFALERVLMMHPNHHRARLELARAYYLMQDFTASRKEFETVLEFKPPPNVEQRVKLYLERIDKHLRNLRWRLSGYASLIAGYDTNINSATKEEKVEIPAFAEVTLSEESRELEDEFVEIGAATEFNYSLSKKTALFAGGGVRAHDNFSYDTFDTTTYDARMGLDFIRSSGRFRLPLQFQQLNVDGSTLRRMTSLAADWRYNLNNNDALSLSLSLGAIRYPDQEARDADTTVAGLVWIHASAKHRTTISAGLYYGEEHSKLDEGTQYGRNYGGLRFGGQKNLTARASLSAFAMAQTLRHHSTDNTFGVIRQDDYYLISLNWGYRFTPALSFRFSVDGSHNDSNISLYQYDRVLAKGALSYAF